MPNLRRRFDAYRVQYTAANGNQPQARIICYEGDDVAGMLTFYRDEAGVPAPMSFQDDKISIGFAVKRFSEVLDLMRHESPLELYFDPEGEWGAILSCEMEPVGENE